MTCRKHQQTDKIKKLKQKRPHRAPTAMVELGTIYYGTLFAVYTTA